MASDKDHEYSMARSQLSSAQKAAKRIKKKVGKGEGNLKAWVQSKITKASDYLDSTADYLDNKDVKEGFVLLPLDVEIPSSISEFNLGLMFRESLDGNSGMLFIFDNVSEKSFHMKNTTIPLDIAFINENGIIESIKELYPLRTTPISSDGNVLYALEVNRGWFNENNVKVGDKILDCIDENVKIEDANGNTAFEVIDIIKPEKLQPTKSNVHWEDLSEKTTYVPRKTGQIIDVYLAWRGSNYMIKIFFPQIKKPSRKEVIDQIQKVYPGSKLWNYEISNFEPGQPFLQVS